MANLVMLATQVPDGLWEKIIFAFDGAFKSYALAVIILTICIKLVTLPIDFINRRSTLKMTEVQTKLQPKLAEIQKRYPDKAMQNQKISELYQKEGFNPMGSCLTMLVVMVISIGIFFTLFASLNNMVAYKVGNQYQNLQNAYVHDYVIAKEGISEEEYNNLNLMDNQAKLGEYILEISTSGDASIISEANNDVKQEYDLQVSESFLWIKNVWIADSPTKDAIPSFEEYVKLARVDVNEEDKEALKAQYEAVMMPLEESLGVNGFFILPILAGVSAFLYQYFLTRKKKEKTAQSMHAGPNANNQPANQGKAMMLILPIIMLIFTLSYNSIFALYIIVSQLVGMATTPLINKIISITNKKTA